MKPRPVIEINPDKIGALGNDAAGFVDALVRYVHSRNARDWNSTLEGYGVRIVNAEYPEDKKRVSPEQPDHKLVREPSADAFEEDGRTLHPTMVSDVSFFMDAVARRGFIAAHVAFTSANGVTYTNSFGGYAIVYGQAALIKAALDHNTHTSWIEDAFAVRLTEAATAPSDPAA